MEPIIRAWYTDDGIKVEASDLDPTTVDDIIAVARRRWFGPFRDDLVHEYRVWWNDEHGLGSDGVWTIREDDPTGPREPLMQAVVDHLTKEPRQPPVDR